MNIEENIKMYNTKEELKNKINELVAKVEAMPKPKTGQVDLLEVIHHYIDENYEKKSGFDTIKKWIVALLIFQSRFEDSQYPYFTHRKTAEKHIFAVYPLIEEAIKGKCYPFTQIDIDEIYDRVIEAFLDEMTEQIALDSRR